MSFLALRALALRGESSAGVRGAEIIAGAPAGTACGTDCVLPKIRLDKGGWNVLYSVCLVSSLWSVSW